MAYKETQRLRDTRTVPSSSSMYTGMVATSPSVCVVCHRQHETYAIVKARCIHCSQRGTLCIPLSSPRNRLPI